MMNANNIMPLPFFSTERQAAANNESMLSLFIYSENSNSIVGTVIPQRVNHLSCSTELKVLCISKGSVWVRGA